VGQARSLQPASQAGSFGGKQMKANEANFLTFLGNRRQFAIPIYQRTYSWAEKECRQLWDDIVRAGANERLGPFHRLSTLSWAATP
jgi:hypothetical protein